MGDRTDVLTPNAYPLTPERAPLVSCIMPTRGRRRFVPGAIACFLAQDYPARELIVLDEGPDPVADLMPADPRIRYVYLPAMGGNVAPIPLGTKRNLCGQRARGELIAHWDDDDWGAPERLSTQVAALTNALAREPRRWEGCGLSAVTAYRPATHEAWIYRYPEGTAAGWWVWSSTLLYTRASWQARPFPDVARCEDTPFLKQRQGRLLALERPELYTVLIHAGNTGPKYPAAGPHWQPTDASGVVARMAPGAPAAP